jgi:cell volume regulation protein A
MNLIDQIFIAAGLLLLLSVVLSKALSRTGIPALLIFLGIGMLAGSDGVGKIQFENYEFAKNLGIFALVFILYSGGLDTKLAEIRPVLRGGLLLSTLGVLISTSLVGAFAHWVFGLSWLEGLVLGAIISSTDAAAVFSVLRSRGVSLRGRVKPLLEFESGSNDPMAVFLTIGLLAMLERSESSWVSFIFMFFQQMSLGFLIGFLIGKLAAKVINALHLEYEGLYPALSISIVILSYGITQGLGGNGFLAVYLAGLILGNERFIHKRNLLRFHDGLAWIMQISMFLVLGLLVFPKDLASLTGWGLGLSCFLIFVARPASVHLSLIGASFSWREKAMVSWVGLRGAVPIILATYPLLAGLPHSNLVFNLVFFVVCISVLLQATSIPAIARLLKVDAPLQPVNRYTLEYKPEIDVKGDLTEIIVSARDSAVGKTLIDLKLPAGVLIVLIHRADDVIVPRGSTIIEPGDKLLVFADELRTDETKRLLA